MGVRQPTVRQLNNETTETNGETQLVVGNDFNQMEYSQTVGVDFLLSLKERTTGKFLSNFRYWVNGGEGTNQFVDEIGTIAGEQGVFLRLNLGESMSWGSVGDMGPGLSLSDVGEQTFVWNGTVKFLNSQDQVVGVSTIRATLTMEKDSYGNPKLSGEIRELTISDGVRKADLQK